jgi:hypothetical protein
MKYILNFKADDLVATTPDAIRYTQGAPLAGILETVLNDVDFRLEIDLHELLAESSRIAHVWGTDDVRQRRPDLDDDQAWEVLQVVEKRLDSNLGVTWNTVEIIANELYSEKPARHWEGRIDVRIADPADAYGQGEVINRLRDLAGLLAWDMPGVEADVDPGSVRFFDHHETTSR